jgi:hypothetical protein
LLAAVALEVVDVDGVITGREQSAALHRDDPVSTVVVDHHGAVDQQS